MDWTDEQNTTVKNLWQTGLSAGQIATQLNTQLGTSLTRNAIIGKVHRLGLTGRDRPSQPTRLPKNRVRSESGNIPARVALPKPKASKALPPPAPVPVAAATPKRKPLAESQGSATILTLEEFMCKWPIGDPAKDAFHFAGIALVEWGHIAPSTCYMPTNLSRRRIALQSVMTATTSMW